MLYIQKKKMKKRCASFMCMFYFALLLFQFIVQWFWPMILIDKTKNKIKNKNKSKKMGGIVYHWIKAIWSTPIFYFFCSSLVAAVVLNVLMIFDFGKTIELDQYWFGKGERSIFWNQILVWFGFLGNLFFHEKN